MNANYLTYSTRHPPCTHDRGRLRFGHFQGVLGVQNFMSNRDQYSVLFTKIADILIHKQRNRKGLKSRSEPNFQYGHRTWLRFETLPHS